MTTVFLDTVGLLALWDQADQWHQAAVAAMQRIEAAKAVSLTTTFVLAECGNAAARRSYRPAVERLRVALEVAGCLIRPAEEEWIAAWQAYVRGDGASAGFVDQMSILVVRRLSIQQVFTHDHHFAAAGFDVLF